MAYAGRLVIKNPASITIGGVQYKDQISKAEIAADTPTQTMRTFGGVDKDRDSTSYTLSLSGHQRRITGGLAKAFDTLSAAGEPVEVVIQFSTDDDSEIATFDIVPVPVSFGGEAGSWMTFEQEFEIIDSPVYTNVDEA